MSLGLPLIAWGSSDTFSVTNCAQTTGQTDAFGGTGAVLVTDTEAVLESFIYVSFVLLAGGVQTVAYLIKGGTAAISRLRLYNQTQAADHFYVDVTWTAGVPSSAGAGVGTLLGIVALGAGWYVVLGKSSTAPVAGDTCLWLVNPAGSVAAATGTMTVDKRNLVLLDYLDEPISDDESREGSVTKQFCSGVEEAWVVGTNYRLSAIARGIPATAQATPVVVSGWEGRNESVGVNCGVAAMLRAGRTMTALRFVPDRATCTTYTDSYLAAPMDEAPTREGRGPYRRFPLVLWNTTAPYEDVP